jgi:hypothetical protein
MGLRRDFTWRFMAAEVTHLLIGVDILSHFNLLVDCKHKRLLDDGISLSVWAKADSSPIRSIKAISGGIPVDTIVAEFRDLTSPTRVQREVRHNNVHYIRTIPGSLVTCRPQQLAPDQLYVSKAKFDTTSRVCGLPLC